MNINFILPSPWLSGGVITVIEYANQFIQGGHQVNVFWPRQTWNKRKGLRGIKDALSQLWCYYQGTGTGQIDYLPDAKANLLVVPAVNSSYILDADVTIATSWNTAEWVDSLPKTKGRKYYFIQHYETWLGPEDRVDRTWKLPLHKIVVSSWLKDIGEKKFSETVLGPIINGVDTKQFFNANKRFGDVKSIGMQYSTREWKGMSDGFNVVRNVQEKYPEIELILFGAYPPGDDVPSSAKFYYRPDRYQLRDIYSMCDIWLCSSWTEGGPPMPSQEAAACKCAIVTTDVGAARDCFVDSESALIAPPRDIASLTNHIVWLIEHPHETEGLALAGYERMTQLTWKQAGDTFLSYLG